MYIIMVCGSLIHIVDIHCYLVDPLYINKVFPDTES